jgi:hypothetical protein
MTIVWICWLVKNRVIMHGMQNIKYDSFTLMVFVNI